MAERPPLDRRSWRAFLTIAGAGAVALLFAACGGTGGPGVASLGSTTTTTNAQGTANPSPFQGPDKEYGYLVSYAECMRLHGVPDFPDPQRHGGNISFNPGADSHSPQFGKANNACKHLLPDDGGAPTAAQVAAETTRLLQWAHCMRTHGMPNFPDPKIISNSHQFGIQLQVDPNSPDFKTAQKHCGNAFGGP